jgi:enoyl-CoA hydratase
MIQRDDREHVRILRLAHGKVSAIDVELGEALIRELADAEAAAVSAVVITGTGSSFSAGVDLYRVLKDGPEYGKRFLPVLDAFLRSALTFPKPLIAAVNGHAIAGGCILAAACDYLLMAEGPGRIGIPELIVGVPFPALPLQIMAARVANGPLRDLVFSGRTLQADEARAIGLVDEQCAAAVLVERAVEVANRLVAIPPAAFALTKEAFYAPVLARAEMLVDLNARVVEAWMQPQTYEAIRKYLERTIPKQSRG